MIRTLIEVSADDHYEHERQLNATLDKLGFEPKPSAEYTRWMSDVWHVLQENKIDVHKLVEEMRAKRGMA